jgi:pantoate--beta-alanine ligase
MTTTGKTADRPAGSAQGGSPGTLPVPVLARTRKGLAAVRAALTGPVVLVPTMGALHDGHRSPLRPAEDFDRYPRPLEADLAICAEEGVSAVFAPDRRQMYPAEPLVTVNPGPVGRLLEGASRPGFFDGVLTVVLKLFQLTVPDIAVFGAKDAQQLALVTQMVTDLELGVRIAAAPLHRDPDGLAASSRNSYLSAAERLSALALSRALAAASAVTASGAGPAAALAAAHAQLDAAAGARPPVRLDYLELVRPDTFAAVPADHRGPALLLVAATVGTTRLIDNVSLDFGGDR